MRTFIFCFMVIGVFACSNPTTEKSSTAADKPAMKEEAPPKPVINYAKPIGYSSDFSIGESALTALVVELWDDWDNNTLDKSMPYFADSVTMTFPDGSSLSGPRDSVMNTAKKIRVGFREVKSSVDAVLALKPTGREETWVCIWGKEVNMTTAGKRDSVNLQENWRFNKKGKIDRMIQYGAKISSKSP